MPTLLNQDIEKLSVSKIDAILKKAETMASSAKNSTAQSSLLGDQKRLTDAKKKIIDFITKEKRKADAGKPSAWVANWRTSLTYGDVMKKKSFVGRTLKSGSDLFTKGSDFLEDHKQAIVATGATAAVAGAAINYLPKLMEMPTGTTLEVIGADGATTMVNETVGMALQSFIKANPWLTAGIGLAGIAAIAVSIPTIRNKVRNSQSYQGKMQARKENAELKSDIIELDSTMPKDAIEYYTSSAIKFDRDGTLEIDQSIIDNAANKEVIDALEADLNLNGGSMRPEEKLKLRTLITRAKEQWRKIEIAEERARYAAENEATVSVAAKDAFTAAAATDGLIERVRGDIDTIEQAVKNVEADVAQKQKDHDTAYAAWETAGKPTTTPPHATKTALDSAVTALNGAKTALNTAKTNLNKAYEKAAGDLGIDMKNFCRTGSGTPLITEAEAVKRVLDIAQMQATMGS